MKTRHHIYKHLESNFELVITTTNDNVILTVNGKDDANGMPLTIFEQHLKNDYEIECIKLELITSENKPVKSPGTTCTAPQLKLV